MALPICVEGLLRLLFVFIAFGIRHIGWGITIVFVLFFIFWLFGKFGMGILSTAAILFITFLVFFFATAYITGAPLCEFANEASLFFI
ncbi:MAG TPA: hypothetical protein HA360_01320 [Nanoarchaeota archaeon]|nr:hypothetical protein [Candidatus Woesearchaeota archaeon]HIH15661.1 hypothetical protein [Nanoarchaeota archaeon]HIH58770.1 hypothetical protein [Nanoarchaeota archaeon]HII13692.1 hypothetical protein [Nanoarchaeota archaeon]HIJ05372.1 hypothetical protein [Nanoarchaeota archaeon]